MTAVSAGRPSDDLNLLTDSLLLAREDFEATKTVKC